MRDRGGLPRSSGLPFFRHGGEPRFDAFGDAFGGGGFCLQRLFVGVSLPVYDGDFVRVAGESGSFVA